MRAVWAFEICLCFCLLMRVQVIGANVAGVRVLRRSRMVKVQRNKVIVEHVTGLHCEQQETLLSSLSVICLLWDMSLCHLRVHAQNRNVVLKSSFIRFQVHLRIPLLNA